MAVNTMSSISTIYLLSCAILLCAVAFCANAFTTPIQSPILIQQSRQRIPTTIFTASNASADDESAKKAQRPPQTFREGEVIGLRLMQEGRAEDAINAFKQAMKLPGTRSDIIRRANVPGPSPVGGSKGGTEGEFIQTLDEFEYQAAHYNMACAYAALGNVGEAVANLRKAFEYGFDNYATVRVDPDLGFVQGTGDFDRLMDEYDPRRGFPNPFGAFGK